MNRFTIKLILTISVLHIFATAVFSQSTKSWTAPVDRVELLSQGKHTINYYEEKVPDYTLPDALTTENGRKITSAKQWEELRRPELLELFASQIYGKVPNTPYKTEFKLVKEDPNAMHGAATLKLVDINILANNQTLVIHLGLFIPNKVMQPVPAFLLICNRPADENIDFTRKNKSDFWPAEEVIDRGYAVAAFFVGDVTPDDKQDEFKSGIHGMLDTKRDNESWGALAAWAWGARRCLDYLTTDKDIVPDQVALVGHSRGGKTALWAGALDQRFAMICCNEAGSGGSSIARRRYGETIELINKGFPHWFCSNYKTYSNRENEMPVDMHELLALIAPRPLFVASASKDLWCDPKGQYLALYHSLPVYRLYNKKIIIPEAMPPLYVPVQKKQIAYYIRDGIHNLTLEDWNFYMDQADRVLKKKK